MAKGGGVFGGGILVARFLQFVNTVVIIRIISRSDYGIISLASALVAIAGTLALLGLGVGVSRYVAMQRKGKDDAALGRIICTSAVIAAVSSVVVSASLYFAAEQVSAALDKQRLAETLRFFAAIVVPEAMIILLGSVFRGLQRARSTAFFTEVLVAAVRAVLLVACIAAGLDYWGVVIAYIAAAWLGFIAFGIYAMRSFRKMGTDLRFDGAVAGDLLKFCIPLLGFNFLAITMHWVLTLILGANQPAEEVSLFVVARRVAEFLTMPLTALLFLYVPVTAGLYRSGNLDELKRLYVTIAKWATLITLAPAMYFILEGEYISSTIFGAEYAAAGPILLVTTIGIMTQAVFGPNGVTLVSLGRPVWLLTSNVLGACLVVGASIVLTPDRGAFGAALALSAGLLFSNLFRTLLLIRLNDIHPFCADFIKPLVFVVAASIALDLLITGFLGRGHLVQVALVLLIGLLTACSPLITSSVNAQDLEVLEALERKLGFKGKLSRLLRARSGS